MRFLFCLFALLATVDSRAATRIASLTPDQSTYTVGSRAVVLVQIHHQPTRPGHEFHLELEYERGKVNVAQLSENLAVALPPRFSFPGEFGVELGVYDQLTTPQMGFAKAIALYQKSIASLREQLGEENDPEARALLESNIAELEEKVHALEERMAKERTLLEVDSVAWMVNPARSSLLPQSLYATEADRNPAIYQLGERALFSFLPHTDFIGEGGVRENIFRAKLDGVSIGEAKKVENTYALLTDSFMASQVGARVLESTFFTRPLKQANVLRAATTQAKIKIQEIQKKRDASKSEAERAYFDFKLVELQAVEAALSDQLEEILLKMGSSQFLFSVTN